MTIGDKTITIETLMRPAVTVQTGTTLESVLTKMVSEKRNSLAVVDANGTLVGAVNAVDILKEVLPDYMEEDIIAARFADDQLLKEDSMRVKDKPVEEFMSTDIPTTTLNGTLSEAAVNAIRQGRGRITVVDAAHRPIGVLTRTELKQVIAAYLGVKGALTT